MTKSEIIKALNKIVKPVTIHQFIKNQPISTHSKITKNWQALIKTGHIASIQSQLRDFKQLTALGHQCVIRNTDLDRQEEKPWQIQRREEQILYFSALQKTPISAAEISKLTGLKTNHIGSALKKCVQENLLDRQGDIRKARYTLTEAGRKKNIQNLAKTHPNCVRSKLVIELIKNNIGISITGIMHQLYDSNNRTRSRRQNLKAILDRLSDEHKIMQQYSGIDSYIALAPVSHNKPENKLLNIEIVKKGNKIAQGSMKRDLLVNFMMLTNSTRPITIDR